jgi:multidrug efflux pump subunit AcrA (membrane-fusion protein)
MLKKRCTSAATSAGKSCAAQEVATRVFATHAAAHSMAAPPVVMVSSPLTHNLDTRRQFLGQFFPVESVELRAQVGGTLTQIGFKDGDIVHRGDLLFEIDPTPYQIRRTLLTSSESAITKAFPASPEKP